MKLFFKKISYKILIISMIMINLSFFSVSPISEAKLKLEEGELYYTGTQEAKVTVPASIWDKLINFSLADIADYLVGLMTLGFRGVLVGWIELMEIILTATLGMPLNYIDYISNALAGIDTYSQNIVNVESIIFNEVEILNANIFANRSAISLDEDEDEEEEAHENHEELTDQQSIANIIGDNVAKWYYILRLVVIAFMLLVLLFIGVKMAISGIASEKAVYKQMLVDWVVGMIIVFSIHYIMIAILDTNDSIVASLKDLMAETSEQTLQEYEYGNPKNIKTPDKIETTLYETVRTRAYSLKISEGFSGLIFYAVLVYFAWKFALIYFRRMLNIIMLTLLAPLVSASYALNKVLTGKSKIFSTWLSEYIMNVIIQIVHAIIYVSFVSIALELSLASLGGVVLAIVLLSFMSKAEKLLRQLFRLTGGEGSLAGDMMDRTSFRQMRQEMRGLRQSMVGGAVVGGAVKLTYGTLAKPAGELATKGAAKIATAVQNSEKYQKKQAEKADKEIENIQNHLKNDQQAVKLSEDIEKLEEEMAKYQGQNQAHQQKRAEIQAQIDEKQEKIDKIGQAYLESEDVNLLSLFRENLWGAMKELTNEKTVYDKNGNPVKLSDGKTELKQYSAKKNYIIREDSSADTFFSDREKGSGWIKRTKWNRNHIWSKKKDSLSLQFKNNLKLGKLFGMNDAQSKQVKNQYRFWSNKVLTAISLPASLAVSPALTAGLMGKASLDGLDLVRRRRISKGASAVGTYKFKGYGNKGINDLSYAESFALLEIEKLNAINQKDQRASSKAFKKSLKGIRKREDRKEKIIKEKTQTNITEIRNQTTEHNRKINSQVESMSTEELVTTELTRDKNIVELKNGDLMKVTTNKRIEAFRKILRDTYSRDTSKKSENVSRNYKKELIKQKIRENEGTLIGNAVIKYCQENGIQDIKDLTLSNAIEKEALAKEVIDTIESQDVLKENSIDLNGFKIKNETITNVINEMKNNRERINNLINSETQQNELSNSVEKLVEDLKTIESVDKADLVINEINKHQDMLIQEAILMTCEQNEVYDIGNLKLQNMNQIKQNISDIIQEEAIIGDVDIEFDDNSISKVIQNLNNEKEQTNDELRDRVVASTILEYVEQNNVLSRGDLRKKEVREELYERVKDKLTPESSKKSADVISQLKGKKEEIILPPELEENIKLKIKSGTARIKKITKYDIERDASRMNQEQREELENREKRRRKSETNKELKELIDLYDRIDRSDKYTWTKKEELKEEISEDITDEYILNTLFLTQNLEKQSNMSKEEVYALISNIGE